MPRYLIGDANGIVWSEPVNCYDETQVTGKKQAYTTDKDGNKIPVAEGYPCWEDGTALTQSEIDEALAPPQEVQDALADYRSQIQKLCDAYGLTFSANVDDIISQIQQLPSDQYTPAAIQLLGIQTSIQNNDHVSVKEVLDA